MRKTILFILISLFLSGEVGLAQVPITSTPVKPAEQIAAPVDPFQEKISLDYKDADITTIIRSLSYTYGLNLVTSSEVKGKITVALKDVTLAEALDVILMVNGYNYTHKGNIIYITPGSAEGAQLVSEPITLEYIKAGDAQNLLRKVLSPKGDIKVDETFNILVVTDYPANIERLKKLLKSVDQAPQQVLIEAKIVDITSKDLQNLGVTWQIDYNPLHGLWGRGTDYAERAKGTGSFAGPSSSLSGSQIKIDTFVLKGLTATATLDALIQDQKAHLLASPSIAVINNREARIIIGEKVPYKERTQTTTGTTETTKFIDVGTTLRVTPSINEDGYITMAIHPEVSSVKALLDAGPQITTREADTMVRVKEGETIVIGGLIKQEDNRVVSRMPVLGYIPFIGYLFGNRSKDQTQQELTVFITPKILRSPEELIAHGKKRYEDEAIINITTTGSLNAQKVLLEKANHLDAAVGLEARRKDDWMLKNQAVSIYESILSQFPTGPVAPEAGYRAARIYFNDLNEPYRARELCAAIISNYPNSPYAYHAKELYKKIVTILEKKRLEKLKQAGKRDVLRDEENKNEAMGSAIDRALDKEKVEEVRAAKEEERQAREEEKRIARERAESERAAKIEAESQERAAREEAKRKAEEERKKKIEEENQAREAERAAKLEAQRQERAAREEAKRQAEAERKQKIEDARKAREAERAAKLEAQRKAKEKAAEIKRVEAELKEAERAKQEQAREEARKSREAQRAAKLEAQRKERAVREEAKRKAEEERKQKIEKERKAREAAVKSREEERRIARERAEAERAAKLEAKRQAEAEAMIAREKARNRAIELKRVKEEAEREAQEKAAQAKLEAEEKVQQKAKELEIEALEWQVEKDKE